MNHHLIALGTGGARVAEAMLYACAAGVWPAARLNLLLVGCPRADEQRLRRVAQRYTAAASLLGPSKGQAGFSPLVEVARWPAEEGVGSLRTLSQAAEDRLLLQALFTPADLDSEGLRGSPPAVALNWERLLHEAKDDSLCALADALADEPVLVCGSLSDTCCAAGLPLLLQFLRKHQPERTPFTGLLLPVDAAEDAALAKAALQRLELPADHLCLLGLPEDCRDEGRSAHLADWLMVCGLGQLLAGTEGPLTFRATLGAIDWAIFGAEADAWRAAFTRLTAAAWLWLTDFGPDSAELLRNPSRLRERMNGWYSACFPREMTLDDRARAADQVEAVTAFLTGYVGWLEEIQATLPFPLRFSGALEEARAAAAEHYRTVLDLAGQLTQLQYDIKRSGMGEEEIVHRRMTGETEGERAQRQARELREGLIAAMGQQDQLNLKLGGRLQRLMIEDALLRCRDEAEGVRTQLKGARAKIDQAEKVANAAQMATVQAARSQLERLEHHLVALDGRTACARRDLDSALTLEVRTRAPQVDEAVENQPDTLFPQEALAALLALDGTEGKARKQLQQQLEAACPWQNLDQLADSVERQPAAEGLAPAGRLLYKVMQAAGMVEDKEKPAEPQENE